MLKPIDLSQKNEEQICQLLEKGAHRNLQREALELALERDYPLVLQQLMANKSNFYEINSYRLADNWAVYLSQKAKRSSLECLLANEDHNRMIFSNVSPLFFTKLYKMPVNLFKLFLTSPVCRKALSFDCRTRWVSLTLRREKMLELFQWPEFFPMPKDVLTFPLETMNEILSNLKSRKEQTPKGTVFDVPTHEAIMLLYLMKSLLKTPMDGAEEAIHLLLMMPNVNTRVHLPLEEYGGHNALLKAACASGKPFLVKLFLSVPKVSELAEKEAFYSNKELATIYHERKKSMSVSSSSSRESKVSFSLSGFFKSLASKTFNSDKKDTGSHSFSSKYNQ